MKMTNGIDPKYSSDSHFDSIEEALVRIADLAEELSSWPNPDVAQKVEELIDLIDKFHRSGISSLVEIIKSDKGGEDLIARALLHSEVRLLLSAYEIIPDKEDDRPIDSVVSVVLTQLHQLVHLHSGEIELVEFTQDKVTLQLLGTCVDCPNARATLRDGIKDLFSQRGKDIEVVLLPQEVVVNPAKSDLICGIASDRLGADRGTPIKLSRKVEASGKQDSVGSDLTMSDQIELPGAGSFGGQ